MAAINAFKTHRRNSISRWQRRFFRSFSRPWHLKTGHYLSGRAIAFRGSPMYFHNSTKPGG
jgi:hypothetical protein